MSMAGFKERVRTAFDATGGRLPAQVVPLAARQSALAQLEELGLPALRDDAWRYSNLRPLQGASLRPASNDVRSDEARALLPGALDGALRLVFIDGQLDADASTAAAGRTALRTLPAAALPERTPDTRFALLNDLFALDEARFAVERDCLLEIVFIATPGTAAVSSYPRVHLAVSPGVHLTLVERHLGGGGGVLTSAVARLTMARDATCRWYRLQDLAADATHLDTLQARLEAGSTLEAVLLQVGGGSVGTRLDCELAGRGAALQLHAASLADGQRTIDSAIHVRHVAPDTVSQQELRAIATGRASLSFHSAVSMSPAAPGADSRQSLKGLVGGDGAEVNLRPQLEIDVDSVRASHGATTGAIDENMLFYLLSRGIERETARQLLEWAFVETVIGKVAIPALRREFEERTVARLGNAAAREVLT